MKRFALFSGLLVLLLAAAGGWFYGEVREELNRPLALREPAIIAINPGASLFSVAAELKERGWFAYPVYLTIEGRLRNVAGSLKPGEYRVAPGATAASLLETIVAGKVMQHSLTLLEGWTFRQIMAALRERPQVEKTLDSADPRRVMAETGYPGHAAEGRFFPDTYYFTAGETDAELLRRAYRRMETVLAEEWERRAGGLPYQSPYQALIMASLVEKETAVDEERGKIAGVFVRRLEKNMRLQADPTVIYALGEDYDGDIRRKDLSLDSPFNTYRRRGLPPTPIAAAGRASIRAALQPEWGTALYFVATGDGGHHFSDTLAEHNRAVARYLRAQRETQP